MSDQDQNPFRNKPIKVFDIVNPSQVQPDPNSKPVVPSGGPRVEDTSVGKRVPNPTLGNSIPGPQPAISTQEVEQKAEPAAEAKPPVKSSNRRWRIMLILVIGIVLLFVVADLLIDAGVIHTSITPLTHFFHHS